MSQTVRAIYRDGHLDLLEPVDLVEGQSVEIIIQSERDRLRAALGDLLVEPTSTTTYTDEEIEDMEREVEEGFRGVTLSDVIIEERREGP